ncbi:MAG: cyclic nucleotide-binding domain-containing protein [Caldilineaceae bacterium]
MSYATKSEIILPEKLTADQRQQLIDELFPIHSQVFHAADKDWFNKAAFGHYFLELPSDRTVIHLRRNMEGGIVAYAAIRRYDREVAGVQHAIFRAEAGALRDYRGGNALISFGLREVLRYKLAHPTRPMMYIGILIHPTSYLFFRKYGGQVWPNYQQQPPPEISALITDLAASFEMTTQPDNPFVVHIGVSTQETDEERIYWRTCDKPDAHFFVQTCPNYSTGDGLLSLAAFDTNTLLRAIGRFVQERTQRRLDPLLTSAQQWPLVKPLFGQRKIHDLLRRTALFGALPDEHLALLAQTAELVTLPAGRYLFRAGDDGDELYVIAAGAVYVLMEPAGNAPESKERIIDQLATGAMFGELALLSGEPRSATIRTATKSTLIRLKRKPLLGLMEAHPAMRDEIWNAYARRRFADLTFNAAAQFAQLSRQERMNWLEQGQLQTLAAAERITAQLPWLFVLTGTVEIQQQQQWSTLRGPALLQTASTAQLVAQTPTQYVCLPEPEV